MLRRSCAAAVAVASLLAGTCAGCAADSPDGHTSTTSSAVEIYASGCGPVPEHGSGTAFGGHLVATVAHVVAGARSIDVRVGGVDHVASIAAIDTQHDVAVLAVADFERNPVELRSGGAAETGSYFGFGGAAPGNKPFIIKRRIVLESEDIYVHGDYPRAGYDLTATTVAGDSGAGLIVGGALAGVIWARSERSDNQAYAVDISEFRPLLARLAAKPSPGPAAPVPCR